MRPGTMKLVKCLLLSLAVYALAVMVIFLMSGPSSTSTKKQSPPFIYEIYPKYCDIKSCLNKHSLCIYKPFTMNCVDKKPGTCNSGMSQAERRAILRTFNSQRNSLFPHPTDMMKLTWSQDLEQVAQHYVMLRFNKTESCPRTDDDLEYGQFQHIWKTQQYDFNQTSLMALEIMKMYVKGFEVCRDLLRSEKFNSWDGNNKDAVQLFLANTTDIGCSFLEERRDEFTFRMVCNFQPAAEVGLKIFEIDPLGVCPEGKEKSKLYPYLCIHSNEDDNEDIPVACFNRVRLFYNGMIMYPDNSYVFPSSCSARPKFIHNIIFLLLFIAIKFCLPDPF